MTVRFKKLSDKAKMPTRAHVTDAGYDLAAAEMHTELGEDAKLVVVYKTNIAIEVPEGYVGLIFPRSSIFKKSLTLTNSVGVIDSGYRGEIIAKFKINTDVVPSVYKVGDRFTQLIIMPVPNVEFEEVEELTASDRGEGGYGSSDEEISNDATKEDEVATAA